MFSSEWKLDRRRYSLSLQSRCVNGPSLFLNAAVSPYEQCNLKLVSVQGLGGNFRRFALEQLRVFIMSNSYIIKVARPQPFCVSCVAPNKQLNKLVGLKMLLTLDCFYQLMNTVMFRRLSFSFLSYCTLTYCNPFFWLYNFPIVQLEGSLAALLQLTCRYAMASSSTIITEWINSVVIYACCAEEMWICLFSPLFGLKLKQVGQLTEVVW